MALQSGLYHLASSGSTSRFEFARFIITEALGQGSDLKIRPEMISPIPSSQYQTAARRPLNSVLDSSRLSTALAITPPDWSHHARRMVLEILGK